MIGGKLKVDILEVGGFSPSFHGLRNPLNSHHLSDSEYKWDYYGVPYIDIGKKDMILAKKLVKAGGEHRKFLRQIQVWLDITNTRYFWQEFDTYKFNTKNSESTIHTIMKEYITMDDFYLGDDPIVMTANHMELHVIPIINEYVRLYKRDKDYRWVKEIKRNLPESFLQRRTVNTNYEELLNIYKQREHHKLNEEWGILLREIEELPYFKEMILDTLG